MLLKFSEFQSTGVPDALAKSKSPWLNSWLFDFLLDEGIPFQWLRFASMKLIQSNSRGSNNLLSNQLPSKLLTFPLANNSSWVPVSTHSPALNTTLEKHVKNIQLWPCMLIYTYIHLYMLTYIYIYIHYSLFVVSPFWQKKNFQSAMSGYQVDLHLFNICYFRSIPERQPRNRNHKTHVSVEQYGQNEALQKKAKWSISPANVLQGVQGFKSNGYSHWSLAIMVQSDLHPSRWINDVQSPWSFSWNDMESTLKEKTTDLYS